MIILFNYVIIIYINNFVNHVGYATEKLNFWNPVQNCC